LAARLAGRLSYTFTMCGRYRLVRKKEILAAAFDAGDDLDWAPRYNLAPGQDVPVVRQDAQAPVRSLSLMRWGLIPSWSKDPKVGYKMINARAETLADKPAFREPLQSSRCLIPADGFYEWAKADKSKSPYCFTLADDSVFAFAGLWDHCKNANGEPLRTCSIITTWANPLVAGTHDRMPVILDPENYELWLDPGFRNTDALLELLKPYNAESMRGWRVSARVNSVQNDDAECIAEYHPEPPPIEAQISLF
jgi:putative SOS response-associated peptidase YedK